MASEETQDTETVYPICPICQTGDHTGVVHPRATLPGDLNGKTCSDIEWAGRIGTLDPDTCTSLQEYLQESPTTCCGGPTPFEIENNKDDCVTANNECGRHICYTTNRPVFGANLPRKICVNVTDDKSVCTGHGRT